MPIDRTANLSPLFYRDNFRRLLILAFILVFIVFLLMGYILYQHFTKPSPKYFIATSDGRLVEIHSVPAP